MSVRGQRDAIIRCARVALLLGVGLVRAAEAAPPSRLNVLFIAVDDLRPELGCYGASHIKSPNIDRLARTGVRFDRAYCQYAICGPSRASLLTGLRPDTLKIEDIDTFFRRTLPDVVTLPQHFKAHGYTALYFGKVFHRNQEDDAHSWSAPPPRNEAAAEYQLPASRAIVQQRRAAAVARSLPPEGLAAGPAWEAADAPDNAYVDGRTTERTIAKLRELKDQRFFLAVGFHKPHLPFVAPKKYFDLYDLAALPLPSPAAPPAHAPTLALHGSYELRTRAGVPASGPIDEATSRQLVRAYAACVSFVDAQVGRLLDELDALNLRERTIIVLWGDHGWLLGEYGIWGKATNFEIATRVPLIVSAPGLRGAGQSCRALVEFVDVYPTLCELAGLPLPQGLEGTSAAPLLQDPNRGWKQAAFSQFPAPALREWAARPLARGMRETYFAASAAETEARLAREHGTRYDRATFERDVMGYSMRTDTHRFTVWVDRRAPTATPLALELYDHRRDARETVNIAGRPENTALVERLRAQWLAGWRAATPSLVVQ